MRRIGRWLFTEHSPRFEIAPTLLVGVVLNTAGSLVAKLAGVDFIWADSVGTILVAILLGPWWGASTFLLTNVVLGYFEWNTLKYGATGIVRGLLWGYLARTAAVRSRLFAVSVDRRPLTLQPLLWVLCLGAGFVESVFTATTKTLVLVRTSNAAETYRPTLAWLYTFAFKPDAENPLRSWFAFILGDGARQITQSLFAGWLAIVLARYLIPKDHREQLQPPIRGRFLVAAGSVTFFLVADALYQLALAVAVSGQVTLRSQLKFLMTTQALVPLVVALIVLRFLTYAADPKLQSDLFRWRAARETYHRRLALLRDAAISKAGWMAGLPAFVPLVAILTGLATIREKMLGAPVGTNPDIVKGLLVLLALLVLGAQYLRKRRDALVRFSACLVAARRLSRRCPS